MGDSLNEAGHVLIQPNGKILVTGSSSNGYAGQWLIGRYNSDGSLDTSFGNNGIATPYSGSNNRIAGLFLQPSDNKIITAGFDSDNNVEVVVRQNSDGSLDQTFGNGGVATAGLPGNLHSAALQSDGKIVLFGDAGNIFLTRFNSNGSIDTTFGTNGSVTDNFGSSEHANYVASQSDGKILVTGWYEPSGTPTSFVIRYNQDGSHDTSFGSGGYVLGIGANMTYPRTISIQSDGKIILGGSDQNQNNASLARLNTDATLDTSFGTNGFITTQLGSGNSNGFTSIVLQTDGKILGTGFASNGSYDDLALARYADIPASTTVTFDDISPVSPLNGTYAGISWGTGIWDVDGAIATNTTNSISFHSATVTSGAFSFASPSVLLSTGIYSNSNQTALITLSCSGNNPVSMQVSPNAHVTLTTNWVTPCTTVTVTSSNGWNTNLDNLVYSSTQNPGVTPNPTPTPPPAPTGGNTTQGALLDTGDANYMNGTKFTTNGTGGAATMMSVFVGNVDSGTHNKFQMAIYTDTSGHPGTLVAKTATGTLTPLSWNSLSITANLSANTTYWLMYNTNATSSTNYLNNMYFDNGTSGIAAYAARTYGTWPTNFPTATLDNTNFSLYVSY